MAKKVLIVDDASVIRIVLKGILSSAGFEVTEAVNGVEALQKYTELRPDLVTMDITMPEMDGIATVKEIKAIDPAAKIVMCSAMGQKTLVLEAIEAGALNFIIKPFDHAKVMEVINKVLG